MKKLKFTIIIIVLFVFTSNYSQQRPDVKKIKITGKIVVKTTNQVLEYATITFVNSRNPKLIFGGITNNKGEFNVDINSGIYDIKVEFISFKPIEIKQSKLFDTANLEPFLLEEDASQLNEVIVRAEKTTVEIKLDKKVYNVGKDMIVRGGTASDVLGNVPSVTVDTDGNVSLRGNDNVKILIDGRPSNSINIADALKTLSADSVDKVEVITNPSARYDAEGGAGILNIVLKKGKNNGLNGTIIGTVGNPKNYGLSGNINFKNENFNLFSNIGYNDSKTLGKGLTNSDYLNSDGSIQKTINERSARERGRKGYSYNFGMDWYLTKSLTWTNSITNQKNDGLSPENVVLYNYEPSNFFVHDRYNDQFTTTNDVQYTTNFTKKFKKDGHKLTVDGSFSKNIDNDTSVITDNIVNQANIGTKTATKNLQKQSRNLFQTDYVLPIGKNSQFEAGYKGDFNQLITDYNVSEIDNSGNYISKPNFTNVFEYKEKINAIYSQFGSKINSFSYLLGLRYENTNIDANLLKTNDFNNKKYANFFPSAFLTYQISDESTFSINYSRRIARPRSRFINPFGGYSSNINLFKGNPNINPSLTHSIDVGYMTKWKKITFTSSIYFNKTKSVFQFIRRLNGDKVVTTIIDEADTIDANGQVIQIVGGADITTPVYLSTPVNLDNENRFGVEFNVNYSPFKWWKLNGNFNLFQSKISGNYSYILVGSNQSVTETYNKSAGSWFSRISSKITLPYKIDWQTNTTYTAPQNTAQGKSLGVLSANLAFSKDILKDKATISLNVSDVFNSSKMKRQFDLPTLSSYSEMQRRERQINLSFTYRFNKQKNEKEKPKRSPQDDNGDF